MLEQGMSLKLTLALGYRAYCWALAGEKRQVPANGLECEEFGLTAQGQPAWGTLTPTELMCLNPTGGQLASFAMQKCGCRLLIRAAGHQALSWRLVGSWKEER
ncbi:hypothetical protein BCR44DRAFT_1425395 [Catenaria anguillulae PL171]|uniref:Uncharacterized protein n=1 Tax=Catenaria anguillulae PL171 TaxID=765915 RepID=A0A1Y2I3T0_9FUNG|nr:hypothetical protein BCR44DRAFT_1425395 [Catenaria anguillulae PL171]